jgi:hypothetical protein
MADRTPIAQLRRQILSGRGVKPAKRTKRLQTVDEQPDIFPKTPKMKMLEYKYHIKIEVILFDGSLTDVAKFLNGEVERSTISKWRKKYNNYMEEQDG